MWSSLNDNILVLFLDNVLDNSPSIPERIASDMLLVNRSIPYVTHLSSQFKYMFNNRTCSAYKQTLPVNVCL